MGVDTVLFMWVLHSLDLTLRDIPFFLTPNPHPLTPVFRDAAFFAGLLIITNISNLKCLLLGQSSDTHALWVPLEVARGLSDTLELSRGWSSGFGESHQCMDGVCEHRTRCARVAREDEGRACRGGRSRGRALKPANG